MQVTPAMLHNRAAAASQAVHAGLPQQCRAKGFAIAQCAQPGSARRASLSGVMSRMYCAEDLPWNDTSVRISISSSAAPRHNSAAVPGM